jgi:hypothetical protein
MSKAGQMWQSGKIFQGNENTVIIKGEGFSQGETEKQLGWCPMSSDSALRYHSEHVFHNWEEKWWYIGHPVWGSRTYMRSILKVLHKNIDIKLHCISKESYFRIQRQKWELDTMHVNSSHIAILYNALGFSSRMVTKTHRSRSHRQITASSHNLCPISWRSWLWFWYLVD